MQNFPGTRGRTASWTLRLLGGLVCAHLLACAGPPVRGAATPSTVEAKTTRYAPFSAELMSTSIDLALPDHPGAVGEAEAVFAVFREVEQFANEWRDPSPLAAVNKGAGGAPVPVPPGLMRILKEGKALGDLTSGAFDITWAALWGVWDFKAKEPKVPAPESIRARLPLIDYRLLALDEQAMTARLPQQGMKIGLGGIAKGFALARAAETLDQQGVKSYLLSAGGQIFARGLRDGNPWRVGIRDPRGESDDYFAVVTVSNVSVSTSGDYERYFELEGTRYHHILDPRTGMPSRGLRSATVMGPDATIVDALSTAMMVMGLEPSLALAARLPGVEAVLVDEHGGYHLTPGLQSHFTLKHAPLATTAALPSAP